MCDGVGVCGKYLGDERIKQVSVNITNKALNTIAASTILSVLTWHRWCSLNTQIYTHTHTHTLRRESKHQIKPQIPE